MDRAIQASVFRRSLLLQAFWNFEGMQNLGFLFALEPLLARAYPDRDQRTEAAFRHMGCFNTNPFTAGLVLGAVGAMEAAPAGQDAARLEGLKKTMSAAVAAMGDSFFWGALRPAAAAAGMLAWLILWSAGVPHAWLPAGLLYLVLFNVPALAARWTGIRLGFEGKENLAAELKRLRWQEKARWVRRAGLVCAAALAAAALLVPPWGGGASPWNIVLLGAAAGLRVLGVPAGMIYAGAAVLGSGAALTGL